VWYAFQKSQKASGRHRCPFCTEPSPRLFTSRPSFRRHLQIAHHKDIQREHVGGHDVDRFIDLEGEQLARRLHRAKITSMSASERRAYYARRRVDEEAALACGPSSCNGLADFPQVIAAPVKEDGPLPVIYTAAEESCSYLPAGYHSSTSSSSEVSWSFSSGSWSSSLSTPATPSAHGSSSSSSIEVLSYDSSLSSPVLLSPVRASSPEPAAASNPSAPLLLPPESPRPPSVQELNAAMGISPVVLDMVQQYRLEPPESIVDRVAVSSVTVGRDYIEAMVHAAIGAERRLVDALQQLVVSTMTADPSGQATLVLVALAFATIQRRQSRR
jgi:hypothetical protein